MHLGDKRTRFYLGTPTRHLRSGARSERAAAQVAGCLSAEGAAPETPISEYTTKYRSMSLESHANVVVRRNIRLFLPLLTRSAFYVIGRYTDTCGQPCLSLLGEPIAFLRPWPLSYQMQNHETSFTKWVRKRSRRMFKNLSADLSLQSTRVPAAECLDRSAFTKPVTCLSSGSEETRSGATAYR